MPLTTLLEEALEAWGYTRDGFITEIKNLSDADLQFRPGPDSRTPCSFVNRASWRGPLRSALARSFKRNGTPSEAPYS